MYLEYLQKLAWMLLSVTVIQISLMVSPESLWGQEVECYIEGNLCFPVPEKQESYKKDELLLLLDKDYPEEAYKALLKKNGLDELDSATIDSLGKHLTRTSTGVQDPLVIEKRINRNYDGVEASTNNDYILSGIRSEIFQADVYPKSLTGAQEALKISRGKGVLIGMIDGPVDLRHPSLGGRVEQLSLVGADFKSFAKLLHGTTIAGILVSQHGAIGIAPEARVLSITAFKKKSSGAFSSSSALVAKAIDIAISKKVDILNLSFAGGSDRLVKKLVKKAIDKGIIVVASCGNDSSDKPRYPAAIKGVIAVTAVDATKKLYDKANKGGYVDVAAPGVSILSTAPGGRYELSTGTSVAAANVSGSLALLLAKNRNIRHSLLSDTATDLGKAGRDEAYGNGLINVLQALKLVDQ